MILKRINLELKKNMDASQSSLAKKTTTEGDIELNKELIKICLKAVEKYVAAIKEGKFLLKIE